MVQVFVDFTVGEVRKQGILMGIVALMYRVGPVTTRGKAAIDSKTLSTTHRLQA